MTAATNSPATTETGSGAIAIPCAPLDDRGHPVEDEISLKTNLTSLIFISTEVRLGIFC